MQQTRQSKINRIVFDKSEENTAEVTRINKYEEFCLGKIA